MFKELKVEQWVDAIDEGLQFRRKWGLEDRWAELEAIFYAVHDSQAVAAPNIVASTGDALLSTLTVPNPYVVIKATRMDAVAGARVLESVDNGLIRDLNIMDEVATASLHAFIWGKGILKIGFDSEFGFAPELDPLGGNLGATLTQHDVKGNRIEFGDVHPGMPWVRAVLPHDIVVPWGTRDIESAPWVAHRVVRHIEDIKSDPKYSKKRDLQPVMSMEDFVKSYQKVNSEYRLGASVFNRTPLGEEHGDEYCELWEIHDRRSGKVVVIATGHDSFLRNDVDALAIDGHPFVAFNFVPNARSFWTTPDAYYLKPSQAELADISLQATKQRRLGVLKFIGEEGAFSESEKLKMLSGEVGAFAEFKQGMDPSKAIIPLQAGNNQPLYENAEFVRRDAREMVGFSRNQFGEYEASGRRTATEAAVVDRASNMRMGRRQSTMRGVYIKLIRKLNNVIFEHWKMPRLTMIVTPEGQSAWVSYTGQSLANEYRYEVSFVPVGDVTPELRRQQALQLYMALAADPAVDPIKLRMFIINAFNDPEFTNIFREEIFADANVQPMQSTGPSGTPGAPAGQGAPGARPVRQLPSTSGNGARPSNSQSVPANTGARQR